VFVLRRGLFERSRVSSDECFTVELDSPESEIRDLERGARSDSPWSSEGESEASDSPPGSCARTPIDPLRRPWRKAEPPVTQNSDRHDDFADLLIRLKKTMSFNDVF
jgi:hypothetical protein